MKIYLMTDLEGVAGVWKWEDRDDPSAENLEYRLRCRRLLTQEVNAAVAGFFEGGATEVIVNDGHGAGYTIDVELLDERVTIIHGRERPFWLPGLNQTCAATALVGAHAKASTPRGNLCHSMNRTIRDYSFNGISHGEIGMQAMIAGHYGVPMIFLSGDLHACHEVEGFIPGIVTAAVKEGLSEYSAAALSPKAARALICERARASIAQIGKVEPYEIAGPLTFRDERKESTFDPERPPAVGKVINERTREIVATDIIDLFYQMYAYPRQ
jgi:D-amino peptidase